MDKIGFALLLIGGCAMDSASVVPAVMVMTGLAILTYCSKREKIKIDR